MAELPAVRLVLAASTAAEFAGYADAPDQLDRLCRSSGVAVGDRILIDNAPDPTIPDLPSGWRYQHRPDCVTEFDAWTAGMAQCADELRPLLATGAHAVRGFLGGGQALRRALQDPRGSGPLMPAKSPLQMGDVWVKRYVGTSLLIPPAGWPPNLPLARYGPVDLDPTGDPLRPFGEQARVPQPLLRFIRWWCTSPGSEYHRVMSPTTTNLDFLYRKSLSLANEFAIGLRFLEAMGVPLIAPPRTKRIPSFTLGPITAEHLLASQRQARYLSWVGDPDLVCRSHLLYRSSRRIARSGLDRLLGGVGN